MKYILSAVLIALNMTSLTVAHEGGHGPKLRDNAKYGGHLAPAIWQKDLAKGHHAPLIYKGELTRSQDGTIRLYLYDTHMKPLKLNNFKPKAVATLVIKKRKKRKETRFHLQKETNAFVGKIPKITRRPFDIDIVVHQGDQALLVSFDNLD
jgi:hypothetical protein